MIYRSHFFRLKVLGAGGNTYSGIRLSKLGHTEVAADTPDLLSASEFRDFFISFDHAGTLEIGRGEQEPFLTYTHSDPYPIRFIGFSTGFGSTGTWEFPDFGEFEKINVGLTLVLPNLFTRFTNVREKYSGELGLKAKVREFR